MLECLIVGDSIAVGVSHFRKECAVIAKSGINTHTWVNKNISKDLSARTVIISLGSNDTKNTDTYEDLLAMRFKVDAERVYWILPNIKDEKRKQVWLVANKFGDHVIDARNVDRSPDHVHPTYNGYREIAQQTKK